MANSSIAQTGAAARAAAAAAAGAEGFAGTAKTGPQGAPAPTTGKMQLSGES